MKTVIALIMLASLFAGVTMLALNEASCPATEASSNSHGSSPDDAKNCTLDGHAAMNASETCLACIDMLLPDQNPLPVAGFAVKIVELSGINFLGLTALPWQPPA